VGSTLVVVLVLLSFVFGGRLLFGRVGQVFQSGEWTPTQVRRAARAMRREVGRVAPGDRVATLSPLYALEGGLSIYPELATGPFCYRLAHLVKPALRRKVRCVSQRELEAFLRRKPPRALIWGREGHLDRPLWRFAGHRRYRIVRRKAFGRLSIAVRRR
jgi:hypothetical protein